jgi:hypothetical protein
MSSGGILGPYARPISKAEAERLSTAELLKRTTSDETEMVYLIDELERRWIAHRIMMER